MHTRVMHRYEIRGGRASHDDGKMMRSMHIETWFVTFSRSWKTAYFSGQGFLRLSDDGADHGGRFEHIDSGAQLRLRAFDPTPRRQQGRSEWHEPLPDLTQAEKDGPSGPFIVGSEFVDPAVRERLADLEAARSRRWIRLVTTPSNDPERRMHIELFPEYGVTWPVWGATGLDGPGGYGVSPVVCAALLAWQDHWERHYSIDDEWDSTEHRAEHFSEGLRLESAMGGELAAFADVVFRDHYYEVAVTPR